MHKGILIGSLGIELLPNIKEIVVTIYDEEEFSTAININQAERLICDLIELIGKVKKENKFNCINYLSLQEIVELDKTIQNLKKQYEIE